MTLICLVRHGETDWNSEGRLQGSVDIPLNVNGVSQAEKCRDKLRNSHWDLIITSPLKRAKQTATIINAGLNLPLYESDSFIERHYGDVEGMTLTERQEAFPNGNYPNQEERSLLNKRVIDGIENINDIYSGKKILLITHGAVINAILAHHSNNKIGSGKTKLNNACLSNLHYIGDEWKIINYNQVSHLE